MKNTDSERTRLLLLSNSTEPGKPYLEHPSRAIESFLGEHVKRVLFIPFATVTSSFEEFSTRVRDAFRKINVEVDSAPEVADWREAVYFAESIVVGGGNTFSLLKTLRDHGLLDSIQRRVRDGTPFIGWSAGANIACPTIMTTNDMPIVDPGGFEALNLVPFQINPHFVDFQPAGYPGESRIERILEFKMLHPQVSVVGLRDGAMLRIEGSSIRLLGHSRVRVFGDGTTTEFEPGSHLDSLMAHTNTDSAQPSLIEL